MSYRGTAAIRLDAGPAVRGASQRPYLYEVAAIRTFAVSAIFIVHAFAIYAGSWKIDRPLPDIPLFRIIPTLLMSFRLQALVFVAGYVFAFQRLELGRDGCDRPGAFVAKKAKRLLLPWLVFGPAYVLLFGTEEGMGYVLTMAVGPGHLWFLPMLFWCYLVMLAVVRARLRFHWSWIPIYAALCLASPLLQNFLGTSSAIVHLVYMFLGYASYSHRERITRYVHAPVFRVAVTLLFLAWYGLTFRYADDLILPWLPGKAGLALLLLNKAALSVIGLAALLAHITYWVSHSPEARASRVLGNINRYAYGLYVYHQFVMMAVLMWYCLPYGVDLALVPLVLLASGVVGAGILTVATVRTRLGKALIGGA
jgi:peptidoglycan/LPS O-acetylase OafA/YrhL